MARKPIEADWYDHPHYYDVAIRDETPREAAFIEAACRKYCSFPVRSLLEPACGTGRLVAELAARGYRMTGFDLSEPSLRYLRRRLARRKLQAEVFRADMADFRLPRRVDAAFSTFNSFRYLLSEREAVSHLHCVAECLRPGGIYILGMHLLPDDADLQDTERWGGRHGNTRVTVTLRVLETDRRRRIERLRMSMLVRRGDEVIRLRDEFRFRTYDVRQIRRLLAKAPELELREVYDFWYEIDEPQRLDEHISDTVFVLQKRREA